jgi:hypothetical protein
LQRLEGELDSLYDFIFHIFGDEAASIAVLQKVLRKAMRRSKYERYERYLKLWAFRIAVESIRRAYPKFLAERLQGQEIPLEYLSLEEKLAVFLQDRCAMNGEEMASVLQAQTGRVGHTLTQAREQIAREEFAAEWVDTEYTLRSRLTLNRTLEGEPSSYLTALCQARDFVQGLPARRFSEIETTIRNTQLLPLLGRSDLVRWQDLSWQYKLGLEGAMLGVVGLLAVVVIPWAISRVNADAFLAGRYAEVFEVESQAVRSSEMEEITTERLLASAEAYEAEIEAQANDEFANMEFPSGDAYEAGSAPLAPSRQAAAVYRLFVQSPAPRELIPHVRNLFAEKKVRERESSGRIMPGGVYFDGVTNLGTYPQILQEIKKLGQTKTYSHPGASRNPKERARVIVWVQQI